MRPDDRVPPNAGGTAADLFAVVVAAASDARAVGRRVPIDARGIADPPLAASDSHRDHDARRELADDSHRLLDARCQRLNSRCRR